MMIRNILFSVAVSALCATAALAQTATDVVTVGTVSGSSTVDVPVYIRDTAGTPLGIDQPAGSRIQAYSLQVLYSSPAVQSITFTRGGITAPLTPLFENSPAAPGVSIGLLDSFNEGTNLVPFTSNAALPGNQVGTLHVTIAPGTPVGTVIAFTLDPTLTQLTDAGTPDTVETVANGRLTLVAGSITVTAAPVAAPAPTLSGWALLLTAMAIAIIAVRMRMA